MARPKIIEAADPVVTWDEARLHLRIDAADEQPYVELLIAAATSHIDGLTGVLNRAVGLQTVEERFDAFDDRLTLELGPAVAIAGTYGASLPLGVFHVDEAGDEQAVDDEIYALDGDGVVLRDGAAWPTDVSADPGAVIVRYQAGEEGDVPAALRHAILLLVAHWYANREAVVTGTIATALPFSVEALLKPYRAWPEKVC